MNILLTGQCTLHWGRMEHGNIGNYYIIEPFIRELYRVFPDVSIKTTFQMSDRFCKDEHLEVLPMELYYGWRQDDLSNALYELGIAETYKQTGYLYRETPYINAVLESDMFIDFSGDIWGENADFLGKDRFLVGLIKDRIAQLLGKKTVMIAGSPGPFSNISTANFAKKIYKDFDLVTTREAISIELLKKNGFDTTRTLSLACPAFLFEALPEHEGEVIANEVKILPKTKPVAGFILCGWNFTTGPFDKWPRNDEDYTVFAEAVEYMTKQLGVKVFLLSHSNGFPIPPAEFELIHGRDFQVAKQLEKVLKDRNISKDFHLIERINNPWETKALIRHFDMLVSGRVHGAVAGLSQFIPTVIMDYGHQPKAHKLTGFAKEAGVGHLIADPNVRNDIIEKIDYCWQNRKQLSNDLAQNIPEVQKKARQNFDELKTTIRS